MVVRVGEPPRSSEEGIIGAIPFHASADAVRGRTAVVSLGGELDLFTATEVGRLLEEVIRDGARDVVVDMSEVTFLDSTTISALIAARNLVRPLGGTVSLVCPDPNIVRVFRATTLDRLFAIHSDRGTAFAGLEPALQAAGRESPR